jgi:acetylglutamate synthase
MGWLLVISVGVPLETSSIQQTFASRDFVYFVDCIMSSTPPPSIKAYTQATARRTDSGTLDRIKHRFALQQVKQINQSTTVMMVSCMFAGFLVASYQGSMDYFPAYIQDNICLTES